MKAPLWVPWLAAGFVLLGCSDTPPTAPGEADRAGEASEASLDVMHGRGPAAYGNAGIDFLGRVQTTTFAANGATGEMEVAILAVGLVGHFEIDCLNVDGNTATMSGNITVPRDVAGFVPFVFRVVDNGQGGGVDQVSLISFAEQPVGVDCNSAEADFAPPLTLFPIVRGNVSVFD
jgi:hypothetical protein